jgi:dipeptidyl aminopeptidase/acylaminoacyl peptidase
VSVAFGGLATVKEMRAGTDMAKSGSERGDRDNVPDGVKESGMNSRSLRAALPLGLLLLASTVTVAAEEMTLERIAELRQVGEARVSPDGEYVAYTRIVSRRLFDEEDGPAWAELHVIGPDGESRPFVTGQVNVGGVGWTADGGTIAYLARRAGDAARSLYGIPRDGGESRKLASIEEGVRGYSFSPDGRRVALLGTRSVDADLKKEREKGFTQIVFEEDWRPIHLWIHELDVEDSKPGIVELEGSVQEVLWSPAGDRLAIKVSPRELVDDVLMSTRIRVIGPDGAPLGAVDNPGKLGSLAWSPDGEHLAFIATESIHDTREGRLMVTGKNGGEWRHLLPDLAGHVWHVDWRDSDTVMFISYEGVDARLGAIRADGSGERTLAESGGPIWDSLSVSRGGAVVLTANAPDHPREVYRLTASELRPARQTISNPWLADLRLTRREVVVYAARDGLEIEGILFYPLDYVEGRRYPLILAVHGGPEAHYSNGWLTGYNLPAEAAAAEGYFMFYPNYRGSTGRGVAFTETSQRRPAGEEFDDLVDGVDYLIERGLVDRDRVGITGGSYGGYASAWGATYYSERFAAAVMNVGLSDKISMLGTSDIPRELYLVHYLTWPWENWEMYVNASPIYYAGQARTPILILHGDADPRVDPTQSRILYRYLTLQENPPPVRLVLYRGEGHGNQRAASRYDYSLRLMRWMNHYLKGEGGDPPEYRLDYGIPKAEGGS